MQEKYKTIIGLEVHIEPNTVTKMFCGCPQDHFGKIPNTQTCPICLGLPGALPIANKEAIKKTIMLGLALGSKIPPLSRFYRKHYFYPDLPKSFQTSQKESPFCIGGELLGKKINHIHLEEDAGKLVHDTVEGKKVSLIDFNRSGCALIELVTEPVFHSVDEVNLFLKELQLIAKYLGISNADMEKGTMRLEANISLSLDGSLPNYKVEIKNINSFRFLEKALNAEIKRQTIALDANEKLIQETRGYDEVREVTFSQRSKEDSQDYRYFPEADLPPIQISKDEVTDILAGLPELPEAKRKRFIVDFGLSIEYARISTSSPELSEFSDTVLSEAKKKGIDTKKVAGFYINKKIEPLKENIEKVLKKVSEELNKKKLSTSDLEKIVNGAILQSTAAATDYKNGKEAALQVILGVVMRQSGGAADPLLTKEMIVRKLKS